MVAPIMIAPPSAGSVGHYDYRPRAVVGERTLMADSAAPSPQGSSVGDDAQERHPPMPLEPEHDRSAMFAAAVISGALSPTPQSLEQLYMRIGASPIPDESQARLKDLLA
jgi:hypothetical protein